MKASLILLLAGLLVSRNLPIPRPEATGYDSSAKAGLLARTPATKPTVAQNLQSPKPYPLTTCLVSGEGLDSMDERVSTVHNGQTFEFCCRPCLRKFRKEPAKYEAMLNR